MGKQGQERDEKRPVVSIDPAMRFGRPQIKGIPTEAIADMYWAGESAEVVCDEYGLTRHELLVALWHEAANGEYRKRWKDWASGEAYQRLASWTKPLDVDTIPLPPQRKSGEG